MAKPVTTIDVIPKVLVKRDFERESSRMPNAFYTSFLCHKLEEGERKLVEKDCTIKVAILDLDNKPTPVIYNFDFFRKNYPRKVEYFLGAEWVRYHETRKLKIGDTLQFLWVNNRLSVTKKDNREGFMSFKRFVQELEDDVTPSEAVGRYQEYISTQKRKYFEANKDEEWFMNKYHPINLLTVVERRKELARKVANDLSLDLPSGSLDPVPDANAGHTSEAHPKKRLLRKFHDPAGPEAPTICPESEWIQRDIELALALVTKLDSEKGIGNDAIDWLTFVKGLEGTKVLDTLLNYLWRVHAVDYYGMIETVEPKGLRHMRDEGKDSDVSSRALEWEKKLVSRWQERTCSMDPLEAMTAKEKIDVATAEALEPFVGKVESEKHGWKYSCDVKGCIKCFESPDFVKKHLKYAHPDLVMELTSKVIQDIYFQNYMSDPDDPGGHPVVH